MTQSRFSSTRRSYQRVRHSESEVLDYIIAVVALIWKSNVFELYVPFYVFERYRIFAIGFAFYVHHFQKSDKTGHTVLNLFEYVCKRTNGIDYHGCV